MTEPGSCRSETRCSPCRSRHSGEGNNAEQRHPVDRQQSVRHERQDTWSNGSPDGRWRSFSYEELTKRDKLNLDIFWLREESLEDSENLPEPEVLAAEIVEDLQTALEAFEAIQAELEA